MPVPKQRKSKSKRDKRRAQHDKLVAATLVPCPHCGEPMAPHRVCPVCGVYKGRTVIEKEEEGGEGA